MTHRQWRRLVLPPAFLAAFGPIAVAPSAVFATCGCDQAPVPQAATVEAPIRVHDPVLAKEKGTYFLFSTGRGITFRTSTDLKTWSADQRVLDPAPAWTATTIRGSRDHYWAPDISFWNGRWHLYYSVSTFGSNRSAIGLATNTTLDPRAKNYRWVDEGVVFQSVRSDNFNAIDPNVAFDRKGQPWLTFGSFWDGLVILPLDPKTGKRLHPGGKPTFIARRSRANGAPGAIEAPFIVRRGDFFYLFASFDFCCRGVNSTYNVRVGRSLQITGPYLDRYGRSMMEDGGTQILATEGRWIGPGHNGYLHDGKRDLIVYHAYDRDDKGLSKLQIGELQWDREGWPSVRPR